MVNLDNESSGQLVAEDAFFIWVASFLCSWAIRNAFYFYKWSPTMMKRLRNLKVLWNKKEWNFYNLPTDAPDSVKATMMRNVHSRWVQAVSPMIGDPDGSQGNMFRALMLVGAVLSARVDFNNLSFPESELNDVERVFNHFRCAVLVFSIIALVFAPQQPEMFDRTRKRFWDRQFADDTTFDKEEYVDKGVQDLANQMIHVASGAGCLLIIHLLEIIAVFVNFSRLVTYEIGLNSVIWLIVGGTRVFIAIIALIAFWRFMTHITRATISIKGDIWKSFWPEYVDCVCFANLMRLLCIQALWNFTVSANHDHIWLLSFRCVFTAYEVFTGLSMVLRNFNLVVLQDSIVPDERLKCLFDEWRKQDEKVRDVFQDKDKTYYYAYVSWLRDARSLKKRGDIEDRESSKLEDDLKMIGRSESRFPQNLTRGATAISSIDEYLDDYSTPMTNILSEDHPYASQRRLPEVGDSANFQSRSRIASQHDAWRDSSSMLNRGSSLILNVKSEEEYRIVQ